MAELNFKRAVTMAYALSNVSVPSYQHIQQLSMVHNASRFTKLHFHVWLNKLASDRQDIVCRNSRQKLTKQRATDNATATPEQKNQCIYRIRRTVHSAKLFQRE